MFTAALFVAALFVSQAEAASWQSESRAILRENAYACRNTDVVVDEIVKNEHIAGHIKGLPQDSYDKFKVVFYVKTDRWYAHPYYQTQNPQEGVAYAKIQRDGTFRIPTVRRKIPGSRLAVSVVPAPYVIRSRHYWLRPFLGLFSGVLKYSCSNTVYKLNGEI